MKELEKQYLSAEAFIDEVSIEMGEDPIRKEYLDEKNRLKEALARIEMKIMEVEEDYRSLIMGAKQEKIEIESMFREMYDGTNKTIEGEHLILKYRVTKSIIPTDKKEIVKTLVANNKVEEGISSFKKPFLRKLAEVGILPESSFQWNKKISLSIKVKDM